MDPLAKWWYNTNHHFSIQTTPYEIVYGQPAPSHIPYLLNDSKVEEVDESLKAREATIQLMKFHLNKARKRMKQQVDKRRSDKQFEEGDYAYVKLQPYRQISIFNRSYLKLAAKFFSPYKILAMVGAATYKLELPTTTRIHPVFHVSQLKKHVGRKPTQFHLPLLDGDRTLAQEPVAILDMRMNKRRGRLVIEVLEQWSNCFPEDAI
ncbi:uncharacterized protein LOC111306584 [Durio zibethinus]|uniref:Uncharacterized protein LOC111306584 n=1 Tax=Durio zibethinus TaxID=66656 RepID=A0A6P6A593_DURZI|nr:uncharacterized protein LOC111306584 [Durio zibethinus]